MGRRMRYQAVEVGVEGLGRQDGHVSQSDLAPLLASQGVSHRLGSAADLPVGNLGVDECHEVVRQSNSNLNGHTRTKPLWDPVAAAHNQRWEVALILDELEPNNAARRLHPARGSSHLPSLNVRTERI